MSTNPGPVGAVLNVFSEGDWGRKWQFFCPGCQVAHYVQDRCTGPGPVWQFNGDQYRPTFSPSILTSHGPGTRCHSFVSEGRIQFLGDCEHTLQGQTVSLPPWHPEGSSPEEDEHRTFQDGHPRCRLNPTGAG